MKSLLIGDMPTKSGSRYWSQPLSGTFARGLCRAMDLPGMPSSRNNLIEWTNFLYERFDCLNANKKYGTWSHKEAVERLARHIGTEREVVVLFGRKVQDAYADMTKPADTIVKAADFYQWCLDPLSPTGRRQVLVLPATCNITGLLKIAPQRMLIGGLLNEAVDKARALEESRR